MSVKVEFKPELLAFNLEHVIVAVVALEPFTSGHVGAHLAVGGVVRMFEFSAAAARAAR
jgi:hypothetical protein